MQLKVSPLSQVFIQVLLLTSVFHKGLSFMAVDLAATSSSPQVFK